MKFLVHRNWYIAGIVLLLFAVMWKTRKEESTDSATRVPPDLAFNSPSNAVIVRPDATSPASLLAELEQVNSSMPSTSLALLNRIRKQLSQTESKFASQQIQSELDSGRNKSTGLGFLPRAYGTLSESPTTRTFLLDVWAEIDLSAASAYADIIFERSDNSDEWALAMRNRGKKLGEENVHANEAFNRRIKEYLQQSGWLREPTAGYLHGFDAAVYSGKPDLALELARIVSHAPHPATVHAAALALDRMVSRDFAAVIAALGSESTILDSMPGLRAGFMARGVLGKGPERKLVEEYLDDAHISLDEKRLFLNNFPNGHQEISFNLLTRFQPDPLLQLAIQDAAALTVVEGWKSKSTYQPYRKELNELSLKLSRLNDSARRGLQTEVRK